MAIPEDQYGITFRVVENRNNAVSTKPEIVLIRFPNGTEEFCDLDDTEFMNECIWHQKCAEIKREKDLQYASDVYGDSGCTIGEYYDLVYEY